MPDKSLAEKIIENIKASKHSIYHQTEIGDPNFWLPTPELEWVLDSTLQGRSLAGLALRTRSKVVKTAVCEALGYPIPSSFRKTQPRFPAQNVDVYTQKSNNLQVWNEDLSPARRYVLIRVSDDGIIERVKVVSGDTLALLDTTGTLTQKYQARLIPGDKKAELIGSSDTERLQTLTNTQVKLADVTSPIDPPQHGQLLPVTEIFDRLKVLVDKSFTDTGADQERNRGSALHKLACDALGYSSYRDDGRFPDIRHQLLEIKLQTSPTIDLGLVRPDSTELLDMPQIAGTQIRHCDVRYCLFYAEIKNNNVFLTHIFVTSGEKFFSRFPQFQGRVLNKKLQIPLPSDFFSLNAK